MKTVDACVEDVIKRGLEDWVQATEIAAVSRAIGNVSAEASVIDLSLRTIRAVVARELMTIGDVNHDGFQAWDLEIEVALARVERAWIALGRDPRLGEICWLCNTNAGDERARTALALQQTP